MALETPHEAQRPELTAAPSAPQTPPSDLINDLDLINLNKLNFIDLINDLDFINFANLINRTADRRGMHIRQAALQQQ